MAVRDWGMAGAAAEARVLAEVRAGSGAAETGWRAGARRAAGRVPGTGPGGAAQSRGPAGGRAALAALLLSPGEAARLAEPAEEEASVGSRLAPAAPSTGPGPRLKRRAAQVICLWHAQVTPGAPAVEALALAAGDEIYSASDLGIRVLDACRGGSRAGEYEGAAGVRPRGLHPCKVAGGLLCAGADGTVFSGPGWLPRLEGASASPSPVLRLRCGRGAAPSPDPIAGIAVQKNEDITSPPPDSSVPASLPIFAEESGFRGQREGYVFMADGVLGVGYYRTDCHAQYRRHMAVLTEGDEDYAENEGEAGAHERGAATVLPAPTDHPLRASALSKDGLTVYLGGRVGCDGDTDVTSWRLRVGTGHGGDLGDFVPGLRFQGHSGNVLCLGVEDDALFSGAYDGSARRWDAASGDCLRVYKGHSGGVQALAPCGDRLFTAGSDGTVREWRVDSGVCRRVFTGQHDPFTWPVSMALHRGRGLLATGSRGVHGATNVKFWEVHPEAERPGTCLATVAQLPLKQGGCIGALCFARDGNTLFSGASDGSVAAWALELDADVGGDKHPASGGEAGTLDPHTRGCRSAKPALLKRGFLK